MEAASATSTTEALWALAWDGVQEALDIVMAWGAKQGDGGGGSWTSVTRQHQVDNGEWGRGWRGGGNLGFIVAHVPRWASGRYPAGPGRRTSWRWVTLVALHVYVVHRGLRQGVDEVCLEIAKYLLCLKQCIRSREGAGQGWVGGGVLRHRPTQPANCRLSRNKETTVVETRTGCVERIQCDRRTATRPARLCMPATRLACGRLAGR